MSDFDDLLEEVLDMKRRLGEHEFKLANQIKVGAVEEVDAKKGYRISLGQDQDGATILSTWYPHPERGGALKTWQPLTKGQLVHLIAVSGDPRQAHIVPMGGFSDQNPAPSESLEENVQTFGKVRRTLKAESTQKKVGDNVSVTTTTSAHAVMTEMAEHTIGTDTVTSVAGQSSHAVAAATGILSKFRSITHSLTELGNKFIGGLVNHDGIDIGKTHIHVALTRFGPAQVISVADTAALFGFMSGGSGNGTPGGTIPPGGLPGAGGQHDPLIVDNTPWAYGTSSIETDGTADGFSVRHRGVSGIATYDEPWNYAVALLDTDAPYPDEITAGAIYATSDKGFVQAKFLSSTSLNLKVPVGSSRVSFFILP